MPKILSAKAGKLTIGDAFLIALTKTFSERFLGRFIGNATVFSGAIKIGGAMFLDRIIGGKIGDIIGTALTVDGTEDVINNLMGSGLIPTLQGGVQSGQAVVM